MGSGCSSYRSGPPVLDARAYMLRLSKDRERSARWQRAAQLLLAKSDVGSISRQLELALLYDGCAVTVLLRAQRSMTTRA